MLGEPVIHTRFGSGKVTAFAPPRMEVTFDDGAVKVFPYPQAVERFLRFESPDAMQRALTAAAPRLRPANAWRPSAKRRSPPPAAPPQGRRWRGRRRRKRNKALRLSVPDDPGRSTVSRNYLPVFFPAFISLLKAVACFVIIC